MWRRVADTFHFFFHWAKDPRAIGSFIPSSKALAAAMTNGIGRTRPGARILEVGAGTGAITRQIVRRLRPEDRLDIIDRNPTFCEKLAHRFSRAPNVEVHCLSILDWETPLPYDHILVSLPLNNFDVELAEAVLDKNRSLLAPKGRILYFEYVLIPAFLSLAERLLRREPRGRLASIEETKRFFRASFMHVEENIVWKNFPPARVVSCWNS